MMFDMSEFYRDTGCIKEEHAHNEHYAKKSGYSGCVDPLTMVFINMQPLESVYPLDEAFNCGTLFPNLNKPFRGGTVK